MNVNKKIDRFKQWAGERMGGEVKTIVSDDFKALEIEMGLRQEGLDKMHRSMNAYVKAVAKRSEIDGKDKTLPIAHLGGTLISHGEDFEHDSEFGQCLHLFGRTQERMARAQETYIASATSSWLESLERSLAQMKEYQAARKKLETRRLAYDTSLAKMQKAKREDFRVEEELRSQKVKYEESADDVQRRMEDIRDSDPECVADLGMFLEAELEYHEKCREALLQLKADWPARPSQNGRLNARTRSNTVKPYIFNNDPVEELPQPVEVRPSIRSNRTISGRTADGFGAEFTNNMPSRPQITRSTTYESPTYSHRDLSPAGLRPLSRVPSDSLMVRNARSNLRTVDHAPEHDVFADDSTFYSNSSPDQGYGDRSTSPATSHGSASATPLSVRKGPPPPPPSRSKKPPPPPPAKRSLVA